MTTSSPTVANRRRWPRAGAGQRPLLLAALLMGAGSFLPWVSTPLGDFGGMAGGGAWTLYAATMGLAGALVGKRLLASLSALVCGAAAVALVGWQLSRLARLSSEADAWGTLLPGWGLLVVLASGLLALVAARRLHRGEG
jgi:predicted membrane protein